MCVLCGCMKRYPDVSYRQVNDERFRHKDIRCWDISGRYKRERLFIGCQCGTTSSVHGIFDRNACRKRTKKGSSSRRHHALPAVPQTRPRLRSPKYRVYDLRSTQRFGVLSRRVTMTEVQETVVPVSLTLSTSAPICYGSGEPPFIVTTTNQCTTERSICALLYSFPHTCNGVEVRDPERNNRRIGPVSTCMEDDTPDPELDRQKLFQHETELVRLDPGQIHRTSYTFSIVAKVHGLRHSDIRVLKDGNSYQLTLREQRWWWMFEDQMPADCSDKEKREILSKQPVTKWKPECSSEFTYMMSSG